MCIILLYHVASYTFGHCDVQKTSIAMDTYTYTYSYRYRAFYSCSDCKILVTMALSFMPDNHAMHKHSNKLFVLSLYETCSLFKINSLRFHVHSKLLADHLCHGLVHLRLSHVHRSRQELCKVHVRIFFVILGKQCD